MSFFLPNKFNVFITICLWLLVPYIVQCNVYNFTNFIHFDHGKNSSRGQTNEVSIVKSFNQILYEQLIYFKSDPSLYKHITKNKLFAWQHFNSWLFLGLYHSSIIYYFTKSAWIENNALYSEGKTVDFLCFGVFIIHNVVVLTNLKIIIESIFKSYIFLSTIWLSIFGFVITTYIYNLFNA